MKNKIIKLIFLMTIILIGIDQISKAVVICKLEAPIEGKILSITITQNTGVAFGLNSGNVKNIILTLLILLLIINFIRNQKDRIDKKSAVAISFILAGGISNLIDRVIRGGVVDFIELKNFAIFNLADCYIVVGWILFIIFLIKINREIVGGKDCEKQ